MFRNGLLNGAVYSPADGGGGGTGFSQEYVDRLKEERDSARSALKEQGQTHKDAITALKAEHSQALTTLKAENETAVAALRTEHKTAVETLTAEHTTALGKAKSEGTEALTAAQKASASRMVQNVLRSEATSLGLLDMDALKLLDAAEIEKLTVDDAGAVAGAKPLLEAMKTAKPFLFGKGNTTNPQDPPGKKPPEIKHARDMTSAEFAEANRRKAWRGAAAA